MVDMHRWMLKYQLDFIEQSLLRGVYLTHLVSDSVYSSIQAFLRIFTFTFRISLCREKHLADSFFLFYIIHSILLLQQAEFEMRRQSSEATVARKSSAITLALVIRMSTWWCRQSAEKKMMRVREEGWPVFVIDVFVIELCAGLLSPLINNELLYAYVGAKRRETFRRQSSV